jgi:hypothetical protein
VFLVGGDFYTVIVVPAIVYAVSAILISRQTGALSPERRCASAFPGACRTRQEAGSGRGALKAYAGLQSRC